MNPTVLFANFCRISEAPEAIPRLRRFILDLAVRGKLVEQNATEEPASELLKRIQLKQADRKASKNITRPTSLGGIEVEPYPIPSGWQWVRLGSLAEGMTNGIYKPASFYADDGVLCLRMYNIKDGRINFDNVKRIKLTDEELESYRLLQGDLLVNRVNSRELVGKAAAIPASDEPLIFESKNIRVRFAHEEIAYYANLIFQTVFYRTILDGYAKQACGQATVSQPQLASLPFPLPPFSEQKRIVAKVDELMALCNRFDNARQEEDRKRERVALSALHHLSNGDSPDDLGKSTRFCLDHVTDLTSRPSHIPELRRTIVTLAVRGRLVPEDPDDEPVSELLKRIQSEIVRAPQCRKRGMDSARVERDGPYKLPESWLWVRLSEIAPELRYGTSVKCSYEPVGEPVLRIPNIESGRINIGDLKFGVLPERQAKDLRLQHGDILMVRSNGSLNLVGRAALVEDHAVGFCYAGYLVRVRTCLRLVDTRYLVLVLNSPNVREQIEKPIRTTVGLKNVNARELGRLLISLPPLAEQRRIVAKIEELMSLCDRLEFHLKATQERASNLLESVLHHALTDSKPGTLHTASLDSRRVAVTQTA